MADRPIWNVEHLGNFLWKPAMAQRPQFYSFETDSGFMLNEIQHTARFHDVTATYWIKTAVQRERFYAFFDGEPDLNNANNPTRGGIRFGSLEFDKVDPDRGKTAIFQFTPQGISKIVTGPGNGANAKGSEPEHPDADSAE